jgi:hypothetical protein
MAISEIARRQILRMIMDENISWSGIIGDLAFLERLYDLDNMPSTDVRYSHARGDIETHTVDFAGDWQKYWIFNDNRFDLLHCSEEKFLQFLCEMLHPTVRPDEKERRCLLNEFNSLLQSGGYRIIEEINEFGKKRYRPKSVDPQQIKWKEVPDVRIPAEENSASTIKIKIEKPKILFLAASPKDADKLRVDEEEREIEHRIFLAQMKDKLLLVNKGAVRVRDLQLYLNQEMPTIVHFSSHGTCEGRIVLEDDYGNCREISNKALSKVFNIFRESIRCVVLNACFSEQQAVGISESIDCVIGMSTEIGDQAAIAFASAFYLAIASGRNLKDAFDLGVNELALQDIPEEDTPRLLVRAGVDPNNVIICQK